MAFIIIHQHLTIGNWHPDPSWLATRVEPAVAAYAIVSSPAFIWKAEAWELSRIPDYYVLYSILDEPKKTTKLHYILSFENVLSLP